MSKAWNSSVGVDKGWQQNAIVLIKDEEFGNSKSSGAPMFTLTFEVHQLDSGTDITVGSETYSMVGQEIKYYVPTFNEDAEKNSGVETRLLEFYKNTGLVEADVAKLSDVRIDGNPVDVQNPPGGFKGKFLWVLLTPDEQVRRGAPTPEQRAKKELGSPIKNPITSKSEIMTYLKIGKIYGVAQNVAGASY